jgi:peptide/nickel transport system substrate-binding protein
MTAGRFCPGNRSVWFWTLWLLASLTIQGTGSLSAQWLKEGQRELRSPLLDGQPFDLIILNEAGDEAVLKVRPPREAFPADPPQRGMYIFDFAVGDRFQVPFSSIATYKTFNDLLIEEANRWLQERKFAQAFRNYLYVYDRGGKSSPELVNALERCLFEDAAQNFQAGRFEFSLTIFEDLYRRNPDFRVPGIDRSLIEIILLCYDGIIRKDFENEEFISIPKKLGFLVEKYPGDAQELKTKWELAFDQKVQELIDRARREAEQGNGRLAHLASRQAEQLRPADEGIKSLQNQIMQQYPLIVVGTTQPAGQIDGGRIDHWGARRVGRLVQRTFVELTGISEEGGRYQFLNGSLRQTDDMGYRYAFDFSPGSAFYGVPEATPYDIASRLLAAADPDSPVFNVSWQKLISSVRIDRGQVLVTLRSPFVMPLPLMRIPYADSLPVNEVPDTSLFPRASLLSGETQGSWNSVRQDGPYQLVSQENRITTFERNRAYAPIPDNQHPVVVEQLYRTGSMAVDELMRGNIDVVDRVPPADLEKLKRTPGIVVRPYLVPTVHMLVPKIRGDLNRSPYFRSGLSHAIDRNTLIGRVISGGREISGNEVISGPFPLGTDENEQIGYAYNIQVRPTRYNEQLAFVLVTLSLILDAQAKDSKAQKEREEAERIRKQQIQAAEQQARENPESAAADLPARNTEQLEASATQQPAPQSPPTDDGYGQPDPDQPEVLGESAAGLTGAKKDILKTEAPSLVLAHPSSSTASESAEAIARMWTSIGIPTTTRPLPADQSIPPDDDWDFLYVEATMEEPLTDILKLLGSDGIATETSAVLDQTLNNLSNASSWRAASNHLRRLHRQVAVEMAVIPLYQVKEHYAFRNTVAGVGRELIHLYQHIERWKIDVYGSDED